MSSVVRSTGLVHGHCECRYLDETIPVLSSVLALDVLERDGDVAILKHPNTGWKLILHQGGAAVKDKPERNHYGVRVSNNREVDNAYQYLLANKDRLGLKKVVKRKERDGSYSMFLVDPGGWWLALGLGTLWVRTPLADTGTGEVPSCHAHPSP